MLKTELIGRYQPATVDTFNIGVREEICLIQSVSTLPIPLARGLLSFGASIYSPKGLAILVEENFSDCNPIAIYQQGDRYDLTWIETSLNRIDPGSAWHFSDGILLSQNAKIDIADIIFDLLTEADGVRERQVELVS